VMADSAEEGYVAVGTPNTVSMIPLGYKENMYSLVR
jgi:hypothetical protein